MPQLRTFAIRGRRSSRRGRNTEDDDEDVVRVPKQSLVQQAPAVAAMPFYPAPTAYVAPPMFPWPKKGSRKRTQLANSSSSSSSATKPSSTKLAHSSSLSQRSFFGVELNLFTLLAIVGIIAVMIICLNMKSQLSGLESKIQVMLATM